MQEVTRTHWNVAGKDEPAKFAERIKLSAVCGGESQEDQSFSSATPQGSMEFTVSNPAVVGHFNPGDYLYLDLIPCPSQG